MLTEFKEKCKSWVGEKTDLDAENLTDIWHLGVFYAIGLINYYLFFLVKVEKFDPKKWGIHILYVGFEHLAYIFGGLVFGLAANKFGARLMLRYSTFFSAMGSFSFCIVEYVHPLHYPICSALAKALFCFGFAAGIGLIYTLVVEKFYRYKRTWATALICTIGFLGPMIAVVGVWLTNKIDNKATWLPFFVGGLLTFWINRYRYIPFEATIRIIQKRKKPRVLGMLQPLLVYLIKNFPSDAYSLIVNVFYPITKANQKKEAALKFWNCVLMGISIQYFVFLIQKVDKLPFYNLVAKTYFDVPINHIGMFLRALGIIIGTIWIAYDSKKKQQRRNTIIRCLICQAIVFIVFFIPALPFDMIADYQTIIFIFTTLSIGITNGIWFLILLQTAEQFSVDERPAMMTLMPNVYRVSTFVLIILNFIPVNNFNVQDDFLISQPYSLIGWGFFFILLSIHGTNSLVDNFEGDAFYIDEESNKSIVTSKLRHEIAQISSDIIVAEDSKAYLRCINDIIFKHLKEHLKEHFFFNNIFYFDRHNLEELGSTLSHKEKASYNKSAYERYNIRNEDPTKFHIVSKQLVNAGLCISLSKWVAEKKMISGIFLWRSAKGQVLSPDEKPEYRPEEGNSCYTVFDLSMISINNINHYQPLIQDDLTAQEARLLLSELLENATFDDVYFKKMFRIDEDTEGSAVNKLKTNILLHRLDAENYPKGSYYAYFLKPYTSLERLQGIFFIKTIVPLKRHRLGQLRDLITIVMLQRADEMLKRTNEMILDEDNHSKRHEIKIIKNQIGELRTATKRRDKEIALSSIEKIDAIVKHIDNLTDINYILMKSSPKKTIHEKHKDWDIVKNEPINLRNELLNVIDLVQHSIDALRISDGEHKDIVKNSVLPELKNYVEQSMPINVEITVLPAAFKVVLAELLKNAAFYTNTEKPELGIQFYKNAEGYFELHFNNNVALNSKAFEYIQYGTESEKGMRAHTRGGLRTIKRYLRFPNFNYKSGEDRWILAAKEPLSSDNSTDIYLIIPSSDVKELTINLS